MRLAVVIAGCLLAFSVAMGDTRQPIPPLTGPVVDLTGTLSASEQQQLSQKLKSFHEKYGPQIQVLIIPTTAPEDAFSYSMRVVDAWKLGSKEKDDGLLLFIAKNDRRSQIQVGYGLEGTIPDAIASRLLNEVMAPYFRAGDFYGGINAVVDGVFARITGDTSLAPPAETSSRSANNDDRIPFFVIIAVVTLQIMKVALGRLTAGVVGGPLMVLVGWLMGIQLFFVLFFTLMILVGGLSPSRGGRYSGGGGFGGGGGWSGGGGGFGGGGAGGRW